MTQNKSLKRRVRERMTKTGERYTAARRQVLAKSASQPPAATPGEPLHGPTDRSLGEWFALLDEWGGRERSHAETARWLGAEHGVPPWWMQDITVRYEKHIGRRVVGQRGSTFSASATKTIGVGPLVARSAWLDEDVRARWLPDVRLAQRPSRAAAAARFDVNDDEGRLVVGFDAKAESKVVVSIEHERLPDAETAARWTAFWRKGLVALKELLEAG